MTGDLLAARRGPLAADVAAGSAATVALRNPPWRTLVELRAATAEDGSGADTGGVESVLGLLLPAVGGVSGVGELLAVWLGPGWWLLDAPDTGEAAFEPDLVHRLRDVGRRSSAVDVSAGFAVLELAGPSASAVLAHGCSIDLHPQAFGPGRSARTMLAKAQVVLAQTDDVPTYRIWVRSSFARYLVAWLVDAATEYVAGPSEAT
ncbi:MAG: sarcosine oxidase subunit gamma [Geodermatophilaceae bacterium]